MERRPIFKKDRKIKTRLIRLKVVSKAFEKNKSFLKIDKTHCSL